MLDERDAIAVLEATRQAGHGALAGDALGLDALGLGRRRGGGAALSGAGGGVSSVFSGSSLPVTASLNSRIP